jgi:hypothetical protein
MGIDQRRDLAKQYGRVVARAWADDAFKQRLLAEPAAALAEHGFNLPVGLAVRVYEDSSKVVHLTLPTAPSEELSDEQLDAVAGGDCFCAATRATQGSINGCGPSCYGSAG